MARVLILIGVVFIVAGLLIRFGVPIGRLPGDIVVRRGSGTFYFPIVTCVVVSLVVSLLAIIFRR